MTKQKTGKDIVIAVNVADSFLKRLKGLMFVSKEIKTPLLLTPSSRVHSYFMKIPIDVVYLDQDDIIVGKETLVPWKLGAKFHGVKSVLEGDVGFAQDFQIGDQLKFKIEGEYNVEEEA